MLRTRPATYSGFSQAGENLKKQVSKVASSAQHAAVDIKDAIVEKIQDASEAGLATAASLTADLGERTEVEATKARLSAHDVMDRAANLRRRFLSLRTKRFRQARHSPRKIGMRYYSAWPDSPCPRQSGFPCSGALRKFEGRR